MPSALSVVYPKKSVAPNLSLIPNQILSKELSPDPFQFFFASSLLSFINRSNLLASTFNDLFFKISSVKSNGKPYVS